MKVIIDSHKRSMAQEASITSLVKNIAEVLHAKYPGHLWAVGPSNDYSMLAIWNEALSMKWGMWIRVQDIDPDFRNVSSWAGELLERANVSRGAANFDELNNLERNIAGDAKFDE